MTKILGIIINLLIRLSILYFLVEVLLFPNDPRFAGKAIPIRNFIIVISLSLLFPLFYFLKKRWSKYPWWFDNLYLSIFWLDMAGNSLNLYDSFFYFDLIPHFHGTGAIAAVAAGAFSLGFLGAVGLANIIHILLEAQEYYTDVLFGTHNVRGVFDTVNDMVVGVAGSTFYVGILLAKRPAWLAKIIKTKLLVLFALTGFILFFRGHIEADVKTLLLILQEFPQIPIKPLYWIAKKPQSQRIELTVSNGKVVADIFLPSQKPAPALILAMGVRTQEKDKPVILHFADTMARLGYVVMWPRHERLDYGMPDFENKETFIKAFEYLESDKAVKPERISFLGFSVGSSIALVAAVDPRIAERVHAVVFFGGYYDVRAYISAIEKKGGWQPAEGAVNHLKEILAARGLHSQSEFSETELNDIDPSKHISSLRAKIFILHDRNDSYVPYAESLKLIDALSEDLVGKFTLVSLFEHVQPKKGFSFEQIKDFVKLYQFALATLEYL